MKVVGRMKSIYDLDERKHFENLYKCDPFEFAFKHQMFITNCIDPSVNYRYVAFIENDCLADKYIINWVLRLEDGERLYTFNNCSGFFTAQHIAYYQLYRNGKEIDMWYVDNENFDIKMEDFAEECDCHCLDAEEQKVLLFAKMESIFNCNDITENNVLFIGGL